jgi:hypothetical protein
VDQVLVVTNQVFNFLAMIVPILLASGFINKYVPLFQKISNDWTPIFNAIIAFLAMFGTPVAHAGIFGDVKSALDMPAKMVAACVISYFTSKFSDKFLHPLLPPGASPSRLKDPTTPTFVR